MDERTDSSASQPSAVPPSVPAAAMRPCDTCGAPVDPLRAPFVAYLDGAFRYYDAPDCHARRASNHPLEAPSRSADGPMHPTPARAPEAPYVASVMPERPSVEQVADMLGLERASLPDDVRSLASGAPAPPPAPRAPAVASPASPQLAPLAGSVACALLATLFAQPFVPPAARTALCAVCALVAFALALHALRALRESHPALLLALAPPALGPVVLLLAAVFALPGASGPSDRLAAAAVLAAAIPLAALAVQYTLDRARDALAAPSLDLPRTARVVRTPDAGPVEARAVRAGEEVRVEAGERVPVDGVVREGEARVVMFPGAEARACVEGDSVLAGAHVLDGLLRVLSTRAGDDVALARLTRLADLSAAPTTRVARAGDLVAWALPVVPIALGIAGVVLRPATGDDTLTRVACALVAAPLALCAVLARVPSLHAVARAASRGVIFRDLAALDAAERVGTVVFCVRGTVTVGRLELVDVVSLGARTERELIARVAAAEDVARDHPIARAIAAVALARGARVESVRRPALVPGRGITAVSAAGESMAVGSRQLLLAEGVSAAPAEDVARAIEGQGRTAVFVAIAGRVEGVFGFEDPLRDEARPSVQTLMDAGFDLALLSGESSGTVEAIGLALDVTNVRPEVAPDERAAAVRSIAEVGGVVAVMGNPRRDGASLSAADVAISLAAAGGTTGETAIALASDDLRAAAGALTMARAVHRRAVRNVALSAAGGVVASALVAALPSLGALGALALCAVATAGALGVAREG